MNPPYTRKQLQTFNPRDNMRLTAIDNTVESLTHIILSAAAGTTPIQYYNWKIIGRHKIVIYKEAYINNMYIKNPYNDLYESFPDILPDVIEQLKVSFPDVDFCQDEIASYLIVDWSE